MAASITVRELLVKLGIQVDEAKIDRFDKRIAGIKQQFGSLSQASQLRGAEKGRKAMHGVATEAKRAAEHIDRTGREADQAGRQLQRAEGKAHRLRGALQGAQTTASKVKAAIAGIAALLLGSRIIRFFTTDFATGADQAAKMSRAMGLAVETYQALGHAARLSGIDQAEVDKAMLQLGKRARDAITGQKKQKEAYAELGVQLTDHNGKLKDQEALLLEAADRFAAMPQGTRKTALAMELMGRSGAKMIPLLNEGSAGIKRMMLEARELGLVFDQRTAKAAENFQDEMLRAKSAVLGLRNVIAASLLPALTAQLKRFTDWMRHGNNAEKLLSRLKTGALAVAAVFAVMVSAKVIAGIKTIVALLQGGFVATGIGAAVLLLFELVRFAQGKGSLIDKLFGDPKSAAEFRAVLLEVWGALVALWKEVQPALRELWNELKPVLKELWDQVRPMIPHLIKGLAKLLIAFIKLQTLVIKGWKKIGPVIGKVLGGLIMVQQRIWEFWRSFFAYFQRAWELSADALRPFQTAWDRIINGITRAFDRVRSTFDRVVSSVRAGINRIKAPFERAAEAVKQAWDRVTGAIMRPLRLIGRGPKVLTDALGLTEGRSVIDVPKAPPGGPLSALPRTVPGPRGGTTVNQHASLGNVHLTFQGGADLDEHKVGEIVRTTIGDVFREGFRDLRPVAS